MDAGDTAYGYLDNAQFSGLFDKAGDFWSGDIKAAADLLLGQIAFIVKFANFLQEPIIDDLLPCM